MKKLLLKLISKKVVVNGQEYGQRPDSGIQQKLFDYLSISIFKSSYRKNPRYKIEDINTILDKTKELFMVKNFAYQIDIRDNPTPVMQIVHPIMISDLMQTERNKEFGFSLYLVFDSTLKHEKENLDKFKSLFSENEYIEFESGQESLGVVIHCGQDNRIVKSKIKEILFKVFNKPPSTEYQFSLHNNGRIE